MCIRVERHVQIEQSVKCCSIKLHLKNKNKYIFIENFFLNLDENKERCLVFFKSVKYENRFGMCKSYMFSC